jgi:hypothetical protein
MKYRLVRLGLDFAETVHAAPPPQDPLRRRCAEWDLLFRSLFMPMATAPRHLSYKHKVRGLESVSVGHDPTL